MSVATELPPVVYIPERARRASGLAAVRSHLTLVTAGEPGLVSPAVPAIQRAQPNTTPLRLTRRGARALAAFVALLGLAMLSIGYLSFPATSSANRPTPTGAVTVQSGDTLWSIALRVAPDRDPRAVVDELRSHNHLVGVALTPGQTLKLN